MYDRWAGTSPHQPEAVAAIAQAIKNNAVLTCILLRFEQGNKDKVNQGSTYARILITYDWSIKINWSFRSFTEFPPRSGFNIVISAPNGAESNGGEMDSRLCQVNLECRLRLVSKR